MKKSDLRTGMIVKNRAGNSFRVDKSKNTIEGAGGYSGWDNLNNYNDDLTAKGTSAEMRQLDIMEVTIWTRPRQMTVQQLIESHKQHTGEYVEVV